MRKYQNHIEVLEAIETLKKELPLHADSSVGQSDIMDRLSTLYACLEIAEIKSMILELKGLDQRVKETLPRKKKAA